ncbi:MAG: hypothetical protein JO307_26190 [Bryobacterales bacterium]|nr:hypothetical protein [Bryobacterales bacterium]MBV9400962.1 hypothetical protein [Bryobacterales bacterium]
MPIRIDDPTGSLSTKACKVPGAHVLLGIANTSRTFRIAPVISTDAAGRNHQVIIPFNAAVDLVVFSTFFDLADAGGNPLSKTAATHIPLFVPSGQTPALIRLRVTGGG